MATLRNKGKLAAFTREAQEEYPWNGQSRNTFVPRINEEYITPVFEEIEGRVTKKMSQVFSRAKSSILGALCKLDEFRLNPQILTNFGTVPGTFRNTNVENQGTNEGNSQSDPHPDARIFRSQTTQNSGSEVAHDSIIRVLVVRKYNVDYSCRFSWGASVVWIPVCCIAKSMFLAAFSLSFVHGSFFLQHSLFWFLFDSFLLFVASAFLDFFLLVCVLLFLSYYPQSANFVFFHYFVA